MTAVQPEPGRGARPWWGVPWWGVVSSAAAPVLLGAGWIVAGWLQPGCYDLVRQTVSVLAAHGAANRWVMTLTFIAVGLCDVITGLALRPAARSGRVILVVGGIGGMLVGFNPETLGASTTPLHVLFAAIGFVALTIWPIVAARPDGAAPLALRPAVAVAVAALTAALFGWFGVELIAGGELLGLAERAVGELQALWPLAVVASCLAVKPGPRGGPAASQLPADAR